MPHYILDARVATPHFPGIGRYVTNLAAALIPLLSGDEWLTILYDPAFPPSLPGLEQMAVPVTTPQLAKTDAAACCGPGQAPASRVFDHVQMIPISASPFSLQQQWELPRLLRHLAASDYGFPAPDLYHSPYYLMPYRPGMTTALTVYDLIPLLFPEHSTLRARLLFRWATALALRAAQAVIAISEATRSDFLARFRLAPGRIVAIPLAADPIFRPQPATAIASVRERYRLPERYVLYLGSNKPHKNLVRLIEAWKTVTRTLAPTTCQLVIAGAWDTRYPEAKARAEALGLGDQVRFLGPVAGADLPALYAGAAVFVFPSLYEGFGLPVLEAMACGTPVVCSDVASLREVTSPPGTLGEERTSPPGTLSHEERGRVAVLVDPLEVDALAEAICRVLNDVALAADLRERGLRQAARFSWEQTARQTLAVYRRLVAGEDFDDAPR